MRNITRLLALVLCVAIVVGLLPFGALAYSEAGISSPDGQADIYSNTAMLTPGASISGETSNSYSNGMSDHAIVVSEDDLPIEMLPADPDFSTAESIVNSVDRTVRAKSPYTDCRRSLVLR